MSEQLWPFDGAYTVSGSFKSEPTPEFLGLLGSAERMMPIQLRIKRTWFNRLFSRPWRPWLNGWECSGEVRILSFDTTNDEDTEEMISNASLRGVGPLQKRLVRL